jgi:hypothetical protein
MITSRILIGCAPWVARLAGWHDWLRGSFHLVLYNTHLAPLGMSLPTPSSPRGAPGLGTTALWRPPPSSFSSPLPCFRSFASEGPFLSRPPNAPYTTHCRGWPLVPPYPATLGALRAFLPPQHSGALPPAPSPHRCRASVPSRLKVRSCPGLPTHHIPLTAVAGHSCHLTLGRQ